MLLWAASGLLDFLDFLFDLFDDFGVLGAAAAGREVIIVLGTEHGLLGGKFFGGQIHDDSRSSLDGSSHLVA